MKKRARTRGRPGGGLKTAPKRARRPAQRTARRAVSGYSGGKRLSAGGSGRRGQGQAGTRLRRVGKNGEAMVSGSRKGTLSVVVCARNEEGTLPAVLREAVRLQPEELIVVLNGCTDSSFEAAKKVRGATVIQLPEPAGHDVGRGIGAKLSRGDIILFLDGDMAIPAASLAPFAAAVDQGTDVALNRIDPLLPPFAASDGVTRCKQFLNMALGRADLGAASMTAVPHALSRRAVQKLGSAVLAVPPKAQAAAMLAGLRVEAVHTVDVLARNRKRTGNTGEDNAVSRLIAGDHAEALAEAIQASGGRLLEPGSRRPELAAWRNAL